MAGAWGDVTPRRVRLRCKAPARSAEKVPSASETPAASAEKFVPALAPLDQPWLLRELVKYLGAGGLLRVESLSQSTARRVVRLEGPSLWRALCTAAGVSVKHSEWDTKRLKMVCHIAEAFRGECWTLDSFEEKERFIQRGELAFGAPRRAGSGPGVRVSFRLDAWESHRLKGFIRDLFERRYSGEQYEFLNSFFLDQDELRADAAVELQDAWCGRLVTRWGQVRRHVTMRGVVSLLLSWEKVFNYVALKIKCLN